MAAGIVVVDLDEATLGFGYDFLGDYEDVVLD